MGKTLYASYGVLAHEKQPVFTLNGPASEVYDTYNITLPDGWQWAENTIGEPLIESPAGDLYLPDKIITNRGDAPVLAWVDEQGKQHWRKINATPQK